MFGHKINTFKSIEIIQSMLSNHDILKLEVNNKNKCGIFPDNWKSDYPLLNNSWVNKISKGS